LARNTVEPGLSSTGDYPDEIVVTASSDPVVIPDAAALFQGTYEQQGSDLVIEGPDGTILRVLDYYATEKVPDLHSEQGAVLKSNAVDRLVGAENPVVFAQAGASPGTGIQTGPEQIGRVVTLEGTAFATRANGQRVTLEIGDPVFQDDLVETSADSKLGLAFIDETVFSLSANARMILDELVYEPGGSDNSMAFNLVQGTFVFITGQVAPTGEMKIETPVATMGIRGTTPIVMINGENGNTEFGILKDPDGKIGEYILYDKITGATIRSIVDEGSIVRLDSVGGDPTEVVVDAARLAERAEAQDNAYFLYNAARNQNTLQQPDTGPGDSPNGNGPPGIDNGPGSSGLDGFNINPPTPPTRGQPNEPPDNTNDPQSFPDFFDPIGFDPIIDTNIPPIAEDLVFHLSEDVPIAEGDLSVVDLDGDDIIAYEIVDQPDFGFVFSNGDGSFTFISDPIFDLLGQGEVLPISFSYRAVDELGAVSNAGTVTILIHGENDAPEADPIVIASTDEDGGPFPFDLLSTAFDPDYTDDLSVENLTATSTDPGREISFVIDNESGVLTFDPRQFNDLADGESETVFFDYDIVDSFGASTTNYAEITITGKNDAPVTGDDGPFAVGPGVTFNVAFATLLANDFDPEGDTFDITDVFGADNGAVAMGPGSTIDFTADYMASNGESAGFFYEVTDSLGASSVGYVDLVIDSMIT